MIQKKQDLLEQSLRVEALWSNYRELATVSPLVFMTNAEQKDFTIGLGNSGCVNSPLLDARVSEFFGTAPVVPTEQLREKLASLLPNAKQYNLQGDDFDDAFEDLLVPRSHSYLLVYSELQGARSPDEYATLKKKAHQALCQANLRNGIAIEPLLLDIQVPPFEPDWVVSTLELPSVEKEKLPIRWVHHGGEPLFYKMLQQFNEGKTLVSHKCADGKLYLPTPSEIGRLLQ